jgi:hypothetical protein
MTQDQYIAILFDDCDFTGPARRAWLQLEYGVKYSDELTGAQRHGLIERLKKLKADGKPPLLEDQE